MSVDNYMTFSEYVDKAEIARQHIVDVINTESNLTIAEDSTLFDIINAIAQL